jgi:hypothetical protein
MYRPYYNAHEDTANKGDEVCSWYCSPTTRAGIASDLIEEIGSPVFLPPCFVALLSKDVRKARLGFGTEVDQRERRRQLLFRFVSSPCNFLPQGAFVPGKGFGLVDTVANDSPLLWFGVF